MTALTLRGATPAATTTPAARRRASAVRVAIVSVAAAATLSGCQWTSTIQTDRPYEPADGTSAHVGDVQINDMLIVAGKKGEPGRVSGYVVNTSDAPAELAIGVQGQPPQKVTVPAGGAKALSAAGTPVTLPKVDADPGAMMPLSVVTAGGGTVVNVPVLAPHLYYKQLSPTGGTTWPEHPEHLTPTGGHGGGH